MDFNALLKQAMHMKASDLHLTVEASPLVRVKGRLSTLDFPPIKHGFMQLLSKDLLDDQRQSHFTQHGHVSFSHGVSGLGRFRIAMYRQRGSIALSIRLVYPGIPTLADSRLPTVMAQAALSDEGMIIVTGAKGSGKSVALAGMIHHINLTRDAHVITIEDPVEFLHKHLKSVVHQREIGTDLESYAQGLIAARKQDADVIAVSDLPDEQTLRLCLDAASSRCLVIGCVRASGVQSALKAIFDESAAQSRTALCSSLADCLIGVFAIRLVHSSVLGEMVPVTEALLVTPAVREIIREDRLHHIDAAMQTGTKYGMMTFDSCAQSLIEQELISREDYRVRNQ